MSGEPPADRADDPAELAAQATVEIHRFAPARGELARAGEAAVTDLVVTEEPLEIRLRHGEETTAVAVTMRTPGADRELALGFLFAEGILRRPEEVRAVRALDDPWAAPGQRSNVVEVELASGPLPDLGALTRHFFASSACGVCGRAGIESLRLRGCEPVTARVEVGAETLLALPPRLRQAQGVFAATGGLHAAALFTITGELVALREDVGRHNALDKLLGWGFEAGRLPFAEGVVLVSGRASFEILQKSLAARVPVLASVSAPSSLAVELARTFGVTLVGFLRAERFNVYSGVERVRVA